MMLLDGLSSYNTAAAAAAAMAAAMTSNNINNPNPTSQFGGSYPFVNYPLSGSNIANVWLSYLKSLQMNYLSTLASAAAATATTTTNTTPSQMNQSSRFKSNEKDISKRNSSSSQQLVVDDDSPPQSIGSSNEIPLDLSFKSKKVTTNFKTV